MATLQEPERLLFLAEQAVTAVLLYWSKKTLLTAEPDKAAEVERLR